MGWTAKTVPVDEHASALLDEPDPAEEKRLREKWAKTPPEEKQYVKDVEHKSAAILTALGSVSTQARSDENQQSDLFDPDTLAELRTRIQPYDGACGKGLLDGSTVLTWRVSPHPDGKPHHQKVKQTLGLTHPTSDFHIYPDHTFAFWGGRGLVGDPTAAAKTVAVHTGLKWAGKTVEQVEHKTDDQADDPMMTLGAERRYVEDQPRDDHGRWTSTGDSDDNSAAMAKATQGRIEGWSPNAYVLVQGADPEVTKAARDAALKAAQDIIDKANGNSRSESRYSDDEPRDDHGRWTDGGDSSSDDNGQPVSMHYGAIGMDEVPGGGRSQAVSQQEFDKIAEHGKDQLDAMTAHSSPTIGLDEHWDDVKSQAFEEAQKSWGGATFDSHTGEAVNPDHGFAVTIKDAGQETVSVDENASQNEFNKAMEDAKDQFGEKLTGENTYLGVFHDDTKGTIDIDPVTIVDSKQDAQAIGAYTHNVGGAYDYQTGDGVWPPHVIGYLADPEGQAAQAAQSSTDAMTLLAHGGGAPSSEDGMEALIHGNPSGDPLPSDAAAIVALNAGGSGMWSPSDTQIGGKGLGMMGNAGPGPFGLLRLSPLARLREHRVSRKHTSNQPQ